MLLFSKELDTTTDKIIEYLPEKYKSRINKEEKFTGLSYFLSNTHESLNLSGDSKVEIEISKNRGWFRRGNIEFKVPIKHNDFNDRERKQLNDELRFLQYSIYDYSLRFGSRFLEINNNRISNFIMAKKVGLNLPETLITTSKKELLNFFLKHERIITKPIHNGYFGYEHGGKRYDCKGTILVSAEMISNMNEVFCPSLFQEYIPKQVELRIFYFDKVFFPMAIFSQLDTKTRFDFRNYNYQKPNRCVPYILSNVLENRLLDLMKRLRLNTGSIDIILTPEGEEVFLEVNPTGQFGWVSENCNYNIYKFIAEKLMNE